jgi:glycine/D-amino acid oxidase-like deaminating enzyme
MHGNFAIRKNIAVIGTGISGMAAAWLLSQKHKVTVYESDRRVGDILIQLPSLALKVQSRSTPALLSTMNKPIQTSSRFLII